MKVNRKINRKALTQEQKDWIKDNAPQHGIRAMSKELKVGGQTIRTYCNVNYIEYKKSHVNEFPKTKPVHNPDMFDVHEVEHLVA